MNAKRLGKTKRRKDIKRNSDKTYVFHCFGLCFRCVSCLYFHDLILASPHWDIVVPKEAQSSLPRYYLICFHIKYVFILLNRLIDKRLITMLYTFNSIVFSV